MKSKFSLVSRSFLALLVAGAILPPASIASLALYDTAINDGHGGGTGTLPYSAALITPQVFDGINAAPFDFGSLTGPATVELIIEGDPVDGGLNGYIGVGSNVANSLRYEQWRDTGMLGFTRTAVADYNLAVPSPTEPTHIAYRWDGVDTMELFVDGALSGTIAGATFEMPTGVGLIGNVSDGGDQGMVGTIHRITTYDRALDDATILQHAEAWLSTGDPSIGVTENVALDLNGAAQSMGLVVKNYGESNVLTITDVTVGGLNADFFAIDTALPVNIDPGEESVINYTFDPAGASGNVDAQFTISSNDTLISEVVVQLSGLIRDPKISVQESLDFGISAVEVSQMIEVENLGGTRALVLDGLEITGTHADKFSVVGPASIPVGSSGNIEVTFIPDGSAGSFDAQLEIRSDDPGSPVTLVDLSAITPTTEGFLTAYDSVIAIDHGNGEGPIPYKALLDVPAYFDTTNSTPFDFGMIAGDATYEFILEGDPDGGGGNGILAIAQNSAFSLRYEQWNDTGVLGFTHSGVEDYVFADAGDPFLLNSPTSATHLAYLWQADTQTMSVFVNGELAGTHTGSSFEMPSGPGLIGNKASGTEGMLGAVHRATIYDENIGEDNIFRHASAFLTGAGASGFKIISVDFDQETGESTIVWNSLPGVAYAVDASYDLTNWNELEDSLIAEGNTHSYSTSGTLPDGEPKRFFRVRRP